MSPGIIIGPYAIVRRDFSYDVGGAEVNVEWACGCCASFRGATPVGLDAALPQTCPHHDPNAGAAPGITSFHFNTTPLLPARPLFSFPPMTRVVPLSTYRSFFGEEEPESAKELELAFDTEPIVGVRAWLIVPFLARDGTESLRLVSVTGREIWQPYRRVEARCEPGSGDAPLVAHEPPWPDCMCGVWATRELEPCRQIVSGSITSACLGEVYLWGRVLEFERGWRARYAYPKRLLGGYCTGEEAEAIGRIYGVPVELATPPRPQPTSPGFVPTQFQQYVLNNWLPVNLPPRKP